MNSEKRSRTVRNDSLDMATIVPHPIGYGKTHADHQFWYLNEHWQSVRERYVEDWVSQLPASPKKTTIARPSLITSLVAG